jgi:hypothetical protein
LILTFAGRIRHESRPDMARPVNRRRNDRQIVFRGQAKVVVTAPSGPINVTMTLPGRASSALITLS